MGINFNNQFDDGFYFNEYNRDDYKIPTLKDIGRKIMKDEKNQRDIFQKIGDFIVFAKTTCTVVGAYTIFKFVKNKLDDINKILNEPPKSPNKRKKDENVVDAEFFVINEDVEEKNNVK